MLVGGLLRFIQLVGLLDHRIFAILLDDLYQKESNRSTRRETSVKYNGGVLLHRACRSSAI